MQVSKASTTWTLARQPVQCPASSSWGSIATMSLTVSAILPSTDVPAKWKPAASAL